MPVHLRDTGRDFVYVTADLEPGMWVAFDNDNYANPALLWIDHSPSLKFVLWSLFSNSGGIRPNGPEGVGHFNFGSWVGFIRYLYCDRGPVT